MQNMSQGLRESPIVCSNIRRTRAPKQPLCNSEEIGCSPNAKDCVHPKDERAVTNVGEQSLRLIIEPFLIAKEEKNNDHRCTKQVVTEIILENTELNQSSYDKVQCSSLCA